MRRLESENTTEALLSLQEMVSPDPATSLLTGRRTKVTPSSPWPLPSSGRPNIHRWAASLLAICLVAEPAHATNWYILNAATGECEVAAQQARKQRLPALASPEAAEIDARHHDLFSEKKDHPIRLDGEVGLVLITSTAKEDA